MKNNNIDHRVPLYYTMDDYFSHSIVRVMDSPELPNVRT